MFEMQYAESDTHMLASLLMLVATLEYTTRNMNCLVEQECNCHQNLKT